MIDMAGRPEKPLDELTNPAAARLARMLRSLRKAAGSPPYKTMSATAHYSVASLSQAAAGTRVPTWDLTQAYIQACGVTNEAEIERWRALWQGARDQERGIAVPAATMSDILLSADGTPPRVDVLLDAMTMLPTLPHEPVETDLSDITTIEEFRGALNQLREAYGLSLRDIDRKSAGVAMPDTFGQRRPQPGTTRLPRAVIHDMLQGHSPLTARNVAIYLTACGLPTDELPRWMEVFYRVRREEQQVIAARQVLRKAPLQITAAAEALRTLTAERPVIRAKPAATAVPPAAAAAVPAPREPEPTEPSPPQLGRHRGQHRRQGLRNLFRLRRNKE